VRPDARRDEIALERADRFRVDLAQRRSAEPWRDVPVVGARVDLARARRQMRRIGPHPRPGHVLVQRLAPGVEERQLAGASPAPHLIVEGLRRTLAPDLP